MKNLNKSDLTIGLLFFVVAIILQSLIAMRHPAEWYPKFYHALNASRILCGIYILYYLYLAIKAKKILLNYLVLPCIGLLVSIQEYIYTVSRIPPGTSNSNLAAYFMLSPFIFFTFLSISIFAYRFYKKSN